MPRGHPDWGMPAPPPSRPAALPTLLLPDFTTARARSTGHGYQGSLVHKSGAIRSSRVAVALGRRTILRPASLREEACFAAAETITAYLDTPIHRIFCLASDYDFSERVPANQAWLFDKWHLGPLRLLNFLVMSWAISKVLGYLQRWETVLQPFSLIGRNMLPFFLLPDRPIGAFNRYNPIAQKRRAVFFYSRDLPIVNSILARSLL
jgi:OpgC protein